MRVRCQGRWNEVGAGRVFVDGLWRHACRWRVAFPDIRLHPRFFAFSFYHPFRGSKNGRETEKKLLSILSWLSQFTSILNIKFIKHIHSLLMRKYSHRV